MVDDTQVEDAKTGGRKRRRHLPAGERERQIVEAAARFFAEHGFDGQMRELARAIGISHPAIFRYFRTKEALLERVYQHVYLSRWNPDWGPLIKDRSMTLQARLTRFYLEYVERIFDYEWVRIFIQSGLKSYDITPRYLAIVEETLIRPVCVEFRAELGLPSPDQRPTTERELELVWALHGKVFYLAIRKYVYGLKVPDDLARIVADDVRVFVCGAAPVLKEICGPSPTVPPHG